MHHKKVAGENQPLLREDAIYMKNLLFMLLSTRGIWFIKIHSTNIPAALMKATNVEYLQFFFKYAVNEYISGIRAESINAPQNNPASLPVSILLNSSTLSAGTRPLMRQTKIKKQTLYAKADTGMTIFGCRFLGVFNSAAVCTVSKNNNAKRTGVLRAGLVLIM